MMAKSEQREKVLLCHNGNEITVSVHALARHLQNHEDDNEVECSDGPTVEVCHFGSGLTIEDVLGSGLDDYINLHEGHGDIVKLISDCF